MNQLEQAEFKMKALFLSIIQIVEGPQHDLKIARELLLGE
jgi:hypothetical protein